MLVKDAMTKDAVVCTSDMPLREVTALLRKHNIGGLPVVDGGELVGMVTESDLISLLKNERISDDLWLPSPLEIIEIPVREYFNWEKTKHALRNIGDMPVKKIMTHRVVTASEDMEVEEAAALMISEGVARLPVTRGKKVVGIITREDIIHAIGSAYSESSGVDAE
jgi:CBS domain-containing protein